MPQNGIRMDGIAALVRGLAACKGLEYLDLQDNAFGEQGSDAMAETLRQWPLLHTLNLSDCVLAEEGEVSPVVNTLVEGSNPKLQTLALQNNNMDSSSFDLLAEAIANELEGASILGHAMRVYGVWQNCCSLGVADARCWVAIDVAWRAYRDALLLSKR